MLNEIARSLLNERKTVFLFENAAALNRIDVVKFVKLLAHSKQEVWLLIDETQTNVDAELFTLLLKNNKNHAIITIGAGVPEYVSMSQKFSKKYSTDRLFLSSFQMLENEGIVQYFENIATEINEAIHTNQVDILLEYIRDYVGGKHLSDDVALRAHGSKTRC